MKAKNKVNNSRTCNERDELKQKGTNGRVINSKSKCDRYDQEMKKAMGCEKKLG